MFDVRYEGDGAMRASVAFPFDVDAGAASTSVVYFEPEAGRRLGGPTDSAEEIPLVLAGEAEVSVGEGRGSLSAGGMALAPAMVPNAVWNRGEKTFQVVGLRSSNTPVSVFDGPLMPLGGRVAPTLPEIEREGRWGWRGR